MGRRLTIREAAQRTGLSIDTLRYYEKAGLIGGVERTEGGRRIYTEPDLDFLIFLARMRATGMPIRDLRRYSDLVRLGPETSAERGRILEGHRRRLEGRMEELRTCLEVLDFKIGLYRQGWHAESPDDPNLDQLRRLISPSQTGAPMKTRHLAGQEVGALGLGCMGMSWAYGSPDNEESLRVLARALELGVNHWDTADLYGSGANEELLAQALKGRRDEVFLATKFGNVTDRSLTSHQDLVEADAFWIVDGTPAYARKCMDLSLQRLGVESVDLYYLHRVDERTPIEESVGAMAELVREGKASAIGLSEASAETIRRAHAVHPIAAVQSEFSLWTRDYLDDVIPLCAELGIAFVPYSPLGRGFLTGAIKTVDDLPEGDWRRMGPRFQEEALAANLGIVAEVERIAERLGARPAQVALAWTLAQGSHILPIPGTKRLKYLEENAAAADLELGAEDMAALDALEPPKGLRYPEAFMGSVNV